MIAPAASDAEALALQPDFAALFGDTARLLQVRTALPECALLPEHLVLRESVSEPFDLVLDCVSPSAHLALGRLIGEQMTVALKQADGRRVPWHGYVKQAAQLGSDGGLVRYRLTMGPWLDALSLRMDSFVFQEKTAVEIVEDVFADYPAAQWRWHLTATTRAGLRKRALCTQYRESDLDFVSRLLAEEGLHYWFEHFSDDDGAEADLKGRARHAMVIADAQVERRDLGSIRFTAPHPLALESGIDDPVTSFMAQRRLTTNAVALGRWDCGKLAGTSASARSALDLGAVPSLEAYDGAGIGRFEGAAAAERAAQSALAAAELQAKRFEGVGAARILRAGALFSLIDHPSYGANTTAFDDAAARGASHRPDDNDFVVLAVEHEASNNLGSAAARLLGRPAVERGTYRNRFECALAAVPVVPRRLLPPPAPTALSARVVGVDGAVVSAERGHRIKVQMHFQRGERPNAGGRATGFGADVRGNAPGDERSGAWVRVAGPSAGANWGSLYTPRIGSEVVVQFIDGDIDQPVIVGGLYGGTDVRPFAAGIDSGVNHPGVIAGLQSQRLDGDGFNQLALDDATGQLRTRLHSSHAAAELGLGHLIQQSAATAQRGAWRGSGFEAGTAGWSAVRAGQGLLMTTSARAGTYGSARGSQMEATEAIAQLRAARQLGQRLGRVARTAGAEGFTAHQDDQAVSGVLKAIDPDADGKHPSRVNGQAGVQSGEDGRSVGGRPVAAFARPVAVFDTPTSLLVASSGSVTMSGGQSLSVVAQADIQQTSAHAMAQVSGTTTSIHAQQNGITAVAAHGPVSVRAHTDALSIFADQSVTICSVNDEIRIGAQRQIVLVAGQSAITLTEGDIEFVTPGAFTVRGAAHAFEAGESRRAILPDLPNVALSSPMTPLVESYDEQFRIVGPDGDSPLVHHPYRITSTDGQVWVGVTDADGLTMRASTKGAQQLALEILPSASFRTIT